MKWYERHSKETYFAQKHAGWVKTVVSISRDDPVQTAHPLGHAHLISTADYLLQTPLQQPPLKLSTQQVSESFSSILAPGQAHLGFPKVVSPRWLY